jgi:hypothetical protein
MMYQYLKKCWYVQPNREKHGLELYGEEYGIPKPKITEGEWRGPLPGETFEEFIAKMTNRVVEDVKINLKVFTSQIQYLTLLYDNDIEEVRRIIGYLMYKLDCALEQENVRWKCDVKQVKINLKLFEEEFERRESLLSSAMPEKILYRTKKKPKKFYNADEEVSKLGQDWLDLLEEIGLDSDHEELLQIEKSREVGMPTSPQLKDWLFSLGWIPATFKYEPGKKEGTVRKIPQISLPRGEGLCPSVKLLYKVEPKLEELDMFFVVKHRIGVLSGFLRDVSPDGFLQAKIAGLTNTLRFKHSELVNLPGVTNTGDWKDGIHIRGCLTAPEGYILCGSDMSSLEDRTKQHYMYFFDPKYVEAMNVKGFDPHLDLAILGYEITKGEMGVSLKDVKWYKALNKKEPYDIARYNDITDERSSSKTVNYGAVYGVGAIKMSLTTGMPVSQCQILLEIYWKKNWSVKEIAKACIVKTIGGQMWLQNPVSKLWYSLRNLKDRFSTLNQGTGVYAFDRWIKNCRDWGIKICGQFHDEIVFPLIDDEESKAFARVTLKNAIEEVNKELRLNRALDIDIKFGKTYASVH